MDSQEVFRALQAGKMSVEDAKKTLLNSQEIFRALQAGRMNIEDAKKALIKRRKDDDTRRSSRQGKNENGRGLTAQQVDLSQPGKHYGLVLSTTSSVHELSLQHWVVPEPEPDEVTIHVKASAINFPDTMCVKGLYPTMPDYPFVPGFEVAGIVSHTGSHVSGFAVGDEVIALTGKQMGGHADWVNVPMAHAVHKPEHISFEDACSLTIAFATVHYAFELGKLAPEEHVLIHTATGGCGLMAIQLARLKGCVIYGTSSRQEKLDILKTLGIPHTLNYKTSEFDRDIQRISGNRGVDVVLNMLSGDAIQKGLYCLGPSGRYLELAVHALKTGPKLDLSKLVRNQSIYSIDIRRLLLRKSSAVKGILNAMVSLMQSHEIVPIVSRIYPIRHIKDALEYVAQGKHIGKVVISHTHQTMIDCTDQCIERVLDQKQSCETRLSSLHPTSSASIRKHDEHIEEGVAIIGISGQFPQAGNAAEFWDNLAHGRDCISEIPATRWSLEQYYDPDPKVAGKTYSKWMGILEDADQFDPLFFNISPAEAEVMDPQQRLFLEQCWRCIEDAGMRPSLLAGSRCGVFVGCETGDYEQSIGGQRFTAQGLMGGSISILSARISYALNLQGPCLAIDTACSSALVAIAEACNSLILQSSDLALAGGVCVLAGPSMHIRTSKAGMLSKDGRCFTFDAHANGFVP
ncbi:MAG: zinc-binding dehydrogenase, partial [Gammaproteobacteria bacterium]|nr:zinc-binding dehydrogenase [Gammaproteobacteria bacterium]